MPAAIPAIVAFLRQAVSRVEADVRQSDQACRQRSPCNIGEAMPITARCRPTVSCPSLSISSRHLRGLVCSSLRCTWYWRINALLFTGGRPLPDANRRAECDMRKSDAADHHEDEVDRPISRRSTPERATEVCVLEISHHQFAMGAPIIAPPPNPILPAGRHSASVVDHFTIV